MKPLIHAQAPYQICRRLILSNFPRVFDTRPAFEVFKQLARIQETEIAVPSMSMKAHRICMGLLPLLAIVLTGCLRYEGDVAVSPDATVSGTLEFGLEKSIAGFFGISSIDQFKDSATDNEDNSLCFADDARYAETSTEFTVSCSFQSVRTNADEDVYAIRSGDEVIFRFRYNSTAEPPAKPEDEYGQLRLAIAMPGPVVSVDDKDTGQVRSTGAKTFEIVGKASSIYDVTVVSSCAQGCSRPNVPTQGPVQATADFSGGKVASDLVIPARKAPYRISSTIRVAEGVSVIVRPGAELLWTGKRNRYILVNEGTLRMKGTRAKPIVISGNKRTSKFVKERGNEARTIERFVDYVVAP